MPVKSLIAALALCSAVNLLPAAGFAAAAEGSDVTAADAADITHISPEVFEEMLDTSVEDKGGVQSEQGDTLRVELAEEAQVLFFTRPGHRAHPAIVAVRIIEENGLPSLATSGWWAGDTEAFEDWFRVFERRNERLSREWQQY